MKSRKLQEALDRIQRARDAYQTGERALYNAAGGRIYSDDEHERRLAALVEPLRSAITDATTVADSEAAAAEAKRLQLQNRNPLDSLTPEQLVVANAKRAFVAEDVETLGVRDLATRLEAVLASDDVVNQVLWTRYISRRVDTEMAGGRGQNDHMLRVRRMLEQSSGGHPDVGALNEQIAEARDLRREAHAVRMATYGTAEALERGRQAHAAQHGGIG